MSTEPAKILEVEGVSRVYGGLRALNGLDLTVREGSVHCIIGPNGAGKSTFFKMVMGTERPNAGSIRYRGRDITNVPTFRRARLGLSVKFQNIRVFGDLTVYQNLFIPLRRHHRRRDIAAEVARLLARIRLEGTEDAMVKHLSHGEQQWLSIAMSLASDPKLLLLDEPAAGMSVEETAKTARIIRECNEAGMSVLVIEHDMEFVRSLAARTSVFHHGQLFAEGSFAEIEANPAVRKIYLGEI